MSQLYSAGYCLRNGYHWHTRNGVSVGAHFCDCGIRGKVPGCDTGTKWR